MPGKARDCAEAASDTILHIPGSPDGSPGSRALLSAMSLACPTLRTCESTPAELVNMLAPSCGDKIGAGKILSLAGVLCALEVPNNNSVASGGQARDRKVVGDLDGVKHYGNTAKILNIAATTLTLLFCTLMIILLFLGIFSVRYKY
ncbi:uncharacterized protein [Narcine bancroftii]|uniref:uncharacterized protein isoform X2 n=1 Tax=Narcine bancroftii TaxID=1343680 RepID=UPI003831008E